LRILVGKTFGIGNAVLSVPMIKALSTLGDVEVLTGSTPDDFGALEVMTQLRERGIIKNVWLDAVPSKYDGYDVAVMSIPFDGRWRNAVHFNAQVVMDARKRPGNVERLGFDMWEKHEIEYQMDNARELGFSGETPDSGFLIAPSSVDSNRVYLGIGYKRDPGGFGLSKHFGAERYGKLLRGVRTRHHGVHFVSTGSPADVIEAYHISRNYGGPIGDAYLFMQRSLQHSFDVLKTCSAYIGNDTGMMHVAASIGMPTCGLFAYPELTVKNPPFCARSKSIVFDGSTSPDEVAHSFVDFVWGDK
jgi:hypothetical protein